MFKWPVLRAAIAALSVTFALSGCNRSADFVVRKQFTNLALTQLELSGSTQVDLAQDAGSLWKVRDNLKTLNLVGVDVTITKITSGGNVDFRGNLKFSRPGQDPVTVASWSEKIPTKAPHSITLKMTDAGAAFLTQSLKGDGKFKLLFEAASSGSVTFDADVTLTLGVTYSFP